MEERNQGIAKGAEALEAVARASNRLLDATLALRQRRGVTRSDLATLCRWQPTNSWLSFSVSANLDTGRVLYWDIDVTWAGEWVIEAALARDHQYGPETVRRFGERRSVSVNGFARALELVVDELLESMSEPEFTCFLVDDAIDPGASRVEGSDHPIVELQDGGRRADDIVTDS